jgi:hypothetical protein
VAVSVIQGAANSSVQKNSPDGGRRMWLGNLGPLGVRRVGTIVTGEGFRRAQDYGGASVAGPTFFWKKAREFRRFRQKMVKKSGRRISAAAAGGGRAEPRGSFPPVNDRCR